MKVPTVGQVVIKRMPINHDALLSIEDRERRAFRHHKGLSDRYVPGESWGENPEHDGKPRFCMVIGEAPGATEDTKLRPFVGRAGILLRFLMTGASLPPTWITNVVKFRPIGNRTPTDAEIESAKPYLRAEWEAIDCPKVIICLGNTPLTAVTGRGGILNRAGKREEWDGSAYAPMHVWPMLHPSFVLRGKGNVKALAEKHWRALSDWLDEVYA